MQTNVRQIKRYTRLFTAACGVKMFLTTRYNSFLGVEQSVYFDTSCCLQVIEYVEIT